MNCIRDSYGKEDLGSFKVEDHDGAAGRIGMAVVAFSGCEVLARFDIFWG